MAPLGPDASLRGSEVSGVSRDRDGFGEMEDRLGIADRRQQDESKQQQDAHQGFTTNIVAPTA